MKGDLKWSAGVAGRWIASPVSGSMSGTCTAEAIALAYGLWIGFGYRLS